MMSLEQQINQWVGENMSRAFGFANLSVQCEAWYFNKKVPYELSIRLERNLLPGIEDRVIAPDQIRDMVEEADLVECLTSPSQYVREYRKWYEEKKTNERK